MYIPSSDLRAVLARSSSAADLAARLRGATPPEAPTPATSTPAPTTTVAPIPRRLDRRPLYRRTAR